MSAVENITAKGLQQEGRFFTHEEIKQLVRRLEEAYHTSRAIYSLAIDTVDVLPDAKLVDLRLSAIQAAARSNVSGLAAITNKVSESYIFDQFDEFAEI